MSDNGANVGFLVSIGSVIATVIAFITFWTRFSDRLTSTEKDAKNALQEAAEVKNDFDNLREANDQMIREMYDQLERHRRENGENYLAIRQKVTDVELFMRDNFVRRSDFEAATVKIEAAQMRMDTKLDRILEQIRDRK